MPGIHQQQRRGAVAGKEGLRQCLEINVVLRLPLRTWCALSKATGVAVAWEIHQVKRRCTAPRHPVHIRQPGLPWRGTRARHPLPGQRVDEARLANVTAADDGELGEGRRWKLRGLGGRGDEASSGFHGFTGWTGAVGSNGREEVMRE